jgi:chromosomal replication initiator protein
MIYTVTFSGYDLHSYRRPVIKPMLTVRAIQAVVAKHFDIRLQEMTSARRSREVARPRQIAMYLCRQFTPRSLPEIGRLFGNRDHTTVMHGIRKVLELNASDIEFAIDLERLTLRLEGME